MNIIYSILPAIIIPGLGYLIARFQILTSTEIDGVSQFVFKLIIPCLLFYNTLLADLPRVEELSIFAMYYIPVSLVFAGSFLWARRVKRFSVLKSSVLGVGASYSNATIIGIPMVVFSFGEEALVPLSLIISVHNLFIFGLGATLNILGVTFPSYLLRTISSISDAAVPSALIVMGASLARYSIRGSLSETIFLLLGKMIILPILVGVCAFWVFELPPLWAKVATLTACMPMGISSFIFAKRFDESEDIIGSGILISTVASLVMIPFVLAWLG